MPNVLKALAVSAIALTAASCDRAPTTMATQEQNAQIQAALQESKQAAMDAKRAAAEAKQASEDARKAAEDVKTAAEEVNRASARALQK